MSISLRGFLNWLEFSSHSVAVLIVAGLYREDTIGRLIVVGLVMLVVFVGAWVNEG